MKKNNRLSISFLGVKYSHFRLLILPILLIAIILALILSQAPEKFKVAINSTYGTNTANEDLIAYADGLDKGSLAIYSWYRNNKPFAALSMPFEKPGKNLTFVKDYSGHGNNGAAYSISYNPKGSHGGSGAYEFGNGFIEIPDRPEFSPKNNGLTIAFWMKPATFDFAASNMDSKSLSRLSIISKFEKRKFYNAEWDFVLYNRTAVDGDPRPKRISFYAYNISDALGVGSYFQDDLIEGEWVHVVGTINSTSTGIYKNGILRDSDPLSGIKFWVDGNATVRLGGINGGSSYNGSIDEVMIFNKPLSPEEIQALYLGQYNKIARQELSAGEFWKACITPHYGDKDGKRVCSNNVMLS